MTTRDGFTIEGGQPEAEAEASNLAEGNPLAPVVDQAKQLYRTGEFETDTHYHTLAVSPEWYNAHIAGREELLGWEAKTPERMYKEGTNILRPEVQVNYKNFFQPPPVSAMEMAVMGQAIGKHWDKIAEDPETLWVYNVHPMLLFADAELAARTGDALNLELDTASRTGAFITGQPTSPFTFENLEETLRKGEGLSFFLDDYIHNFDKSQQDSIAYLLSLTDINRREALAANSVLWWEGKNPDDPAEQESYINWLARAAQDAQAQTREEQGAWNKSLFNWLDAGFLTFQWKDLFRRNILPNLQALREGRTEDIDWTPGNRSWSSYIDVMNKYDPQYYQYTGKVPNPKEWAYTSNLTMGQQVAAASGMRKESHGFAVTSTLIDGFMYIATPGDVAINLISGGAGYASKIARIAIEPTTKLGRLKLAAKVAIPVIGRRTVMNTSGGKLPFGIATRVGWALRSRNIEEFVEVAEKRGVIRQMFNITKEKGIGGLITDFEHMTPIVDTGVDDMLEFAAMSEDYDLFLDIVKQAQAGAFEVNSGAKLDELAARRAALVEEAERKLADALAQAANDAEDGVPTIAPDMIDEILDKNPASTFVLEYFDEAAGEWRVAEGSGQVGKLFQMDPTPENLAEYLQASVMDSVDLDNLRIRVVDGGPAEIQLTLTDPASVNQAAEFLAEANQHHHFFNIEDLPPSVVTGGTEAPLDGQKLRVIQPNVGDAPLSDNYIKVVHEDRIDLVDAETMELFRSFPYTPDTVADADRHASLYHRALDRRDARKLKEIDEGGYVFDAELEAFVRPGEGGKLDVYDRTDVLDEDWSSEIDEIVKVSVNKDGVADLKITKNLLGYTANGDESIQVRRFDASDSQLSIKFIPDSGKVEVEVPVAGSYRTEKIEADEAFVLGWEDAEGNKLLFDTVIDFGPDRGLLDSDGKPIKRYQLTRREDSPSMVAAHEMSFDSIEDAVAASLQINNDLRIMGQISFKSGSFDEIGAAGSTWTSPIPRTQVEQFLDDLASGVLDEKYDSPFRGDLDAWVRFMEDPANYPHLALLLRNENLNTGSALTQYMAKLFDYYDGRIGIQNAMADNMQAIHSSMVDALAVKMRELGLSEILFETDDPVWLVQKILDDFENGVYTPEDLGVDGNVSRFVDWMIDTMRDVAKGFDGDDSLAFDQWLGTDAFEAEWARVLAKPENSPENIGDVLDTLTRWANTKSQGYGTKIDALGGPVSLSSGIKHVEFDEPWAWKESSTQLGRNLMQERAIAFTPEQREFMMNRGIRYYANKIMSELDESDVLFPEGSDRIFDSMRLWLDGNYDEARRLASGAIEGDAETVRILRQHLLKDWNEVQTQWKRMMHYKYNGESGTMIPVARGGRHSAFDRSSSWTTNVRTGEGFSGGPGKSLGFGYVDLDDAVFTTPENVVKLLIGNRNAGMGDTWNEAIIHRARIKSVAQHKLPWRFGNKLGDEQFQAVETAQEIDWYRLVEELHSNPGFAADNFDQVLPGIVGVQQTLEDNFLFGPPMRVFDTETQGAVPYGAGKRGTLAYVNTGGKSKQGLVDPTIKNEITNLNRQMEMIERLDGVQGIVYDLPPLRSYDAAVEGLEPAVRGRSNFGKAFRHYWARTFRAAMPEAIDLSDPVNSVHDLRRTLRALGVEDDTMREVMTKFVRSPKEQREKVIMDAFKQVGRDSGNPILEHMIDIMWKNTSAKRTSTSLAGKGVAEDLGQTANGVVPPTPSYGGHKVLLPDESLFKAMARYRASGKLPKYVRRGFTDGTKGKRADIVQALRTKVGPKVLEELGENADDELLRMAYAMVAPEGQPQWDGLGQFAKWLHNYPGKSWRWLHGTFTRSVLSLQPFRWMIKVAIMEEPLRAGLMGMPNFVMNPKTSIRNMIHAFNISKYDSHLAKMNRSLDEVMARFAELDNGSDEFIDFLRGIGMDDADMQNGTDFFTVRRWITNNVMGGADFDESITQKYGIAGALQDARKPGKKLAAIQDENVRRGFLPDFTWADAEEIVSKSLFSQYMTKVEGMRPVIYSPLKVEDHPVFARQWAQEVVRIKRDPFLELAGDYRYIDEQEATLSLMAHPQWPLFRQQAIQILDHKMPGVFSTVVDKTNNMEVAGLYLEYLSDHVDQVLKPLLEANAGPEMFGTQQLFGSGWIGFKTNEFQTGWRGEVLKFDLYDEAGTADSLNNLIAANRQDPKFNDLMPPFMDVPFTETFVRHGGQAEFRGNSLSAWRKFTNFMLSNFGENATQVLNRRPAYLWKYEQSYKMYRAMGVAEDLARKAAHRKAFRAVNYVYFNQDHIPPLIRKMNGIIPFFGAQVEIASTWAKKIPMAQGPFLGPVQLVRKIDKMFQGLVNSGILDVDYYEGDETGGTQNARYRLTFEPGGKNADTLFGQAISNLGYRAQTGVLDTMLFIRNLLSEEPDLEAEDITQGRITYSFGNPLDWSKENQGILAINQIYLTPTPGVKAGLSLLTRNLDITANNDLVNGDRMSKILAQNSVDRTDFLNANRGALIARYGKKQFDKLIDNPDLDFDLDPEVGWEIPNTSLYDSFVKPWLYPMGFPENEVYTWTEFVPSTWKYMMRGFAIGMGSEDPTSFWNVNPDTGELEVNGFLQNMMLPTASDRYLAASAVKTAIQDYEARTGALSEYGRLALRKAEIADLAILANEASRNPDGKLLFDPAFGSQYEKEYNEIVAAQEVLWRDILHTGFTNASSQLGMRGLFGFISPATPRFISDEQQAIAGYWDARQNADGDFDNLYHDFNPLGVTDVDAFNQLFVDFLKDRSGDMAMQTLRKELPELWAHAYGGTFWAADGAPAEVQQIDDFFAQIESGERQPFAPHVNLQRMFRAHVAASREAQILETYGDDPAEAAAAMLADWFNYNEDIVAPARRAYDQLDWHDEIVTDGDYANYRNLVWGEDDEDTLQAEFRRQMDDFRESIEELEELVPGLYPGAEGIEQADVLSTIASNISNLSEQLGDKFEQLGIQSERERLISEYFNDHVSKYYQELSFAYDALDSINDDAEASRMYDRIRMINDQYGAGITINGTRFPSVQDWRWGRLSPEEQEIKVSEWMSQPVEWLDADAITRIGNMYPNLKQYLPSTSASYGLLINYGKAKDGINEAASFDPETGEPYYTEGQRRKAQAELEKRLRGQAIQMGLGQMVEYMDMWPIERWAVAGALPPSVEQLAGEAAWMRQALEGAGKTPTQQDVVRKNIDPWYVQHVQKMQSDPVYATFFRTLGRDVYGEKDDRKIFERFVLGDRSLY